MFIHALPPLYLPLYERASEVPRCIARCNLYLSTAHNTVSTAVFIRSRERVSREGAAAHRRPGAAIIKFIHESSDALITSEPTL